MKRKIKYSSIKLRSRAVFEEFRNSCPEEQTYDDFLNDLLSIRDMVSSIKLNVILKNGKYHVNSFTQDAEANFCEKYGITLERKLCQKTQK